MVARDVDNGIPDPILEDPPFPEWSTTSVKNPDGTEALLLNPFRDYEGIRLDTGLCVMKLLAPRAAANSGYAREMHTNMRIPLGRARLNRVESIYLVRKSLTYGLDLRVPMLKSRLFKSIQFEFTGLNLIICCLEPFGPPQPPVNRLGRS